MLNANETWEVIEHLTCGIEECGLVIFSPAFSSLEETMTFAKRVALTNPNNVKNYRVNNTAKEISMDFHNGVHVTILDYHTAGTMRVRADVIIVDCISEGERYARRIVSAFDALYEEPLVTRYHRGDLYVRWYPRTQIAFADLGINGQTEYIPANIQEGWEVLGIEGTERWIGDIIGGGDETRNN